MRKREWTGWWLIVGFGLLIGCSKKDESEGGVEVSKQKAPSYFDDEDTVPEPTPKPPTDVDLVRLAAIQYRPRDHENSKDRLVVWTRLSNGKDERILGESPDGYQGPVWLTKSLDTMVYVRPCKSEECAHSKMKSNVFLYSFKSRKHIPLLHKGVKHFFVKGMMFGTPTKEEDNVSLFPDKTFLDIPNSIFYAQGIYYTHAIYLNTRRIISRPVASSERLHLGNGRFLLGINSTNGIRSKMGEYDFWKGKILEQISEKSSLDLVGASSSMEGRFFLRIGSQNYSNPNTDTIFLYDSDKTIRWQKEVVLESGDQMYEIDPYGKWMYFRRLNGHYRIPLFEFEKLPSRMTMIYLLGHSEVVVEPQIFESENEFRSAFTLIPTI